MVDFKKLLDDKRRARGDVMPEDFKPEVKALIARGSITLAEMNGIRANSYEWEAMLPHFDAEAFVWRCEHSLRNCSFIARPSCYDESIIARYMPELLRRYKALLAEKEEEATSGDTGRR
jgi:hypothetical protein